MSDAAHEKAGFPWRQALIVAGVAAVVYFLTLIPKTVEVFIVATLISYGVNPIVQRLRNRMPQPAAIALIYAGLVVGTIVAAVIIIPDTINQLQGFFANGPAYFASGKHILDNIQQAISSRFGTQALPPQLQDIEGRAASEAATLANNALSGAANLVVATVNALVIGFTGVILSYFMLAHSAEIRDSFYSLFPARAQEKAKEFAREVARVVGGFITGQAVLSLFCGVATFIVLLLARSQYALLLGVLTGLLYAVPYLGVSVALVVGALLGTVQSWPTALLNLAVIFGVTRIADILLVPKVMGESVGISPMAIIFAVFAGGELFGLWGLVLAIPAAAIFKVIWNVWLHPWLTGRQ